MKKTITFVVLFALILSSFTFALAGSAEKNDDSGSADNNENYLGTVSEQTGVLLDEGEPNRGLPFSMTANAVYTLLTTEQSPGKYFTGADISYLNGEGVHITGTLYHSFGGPVKYGVCYLGADGNTFYSVRYLTIPSGTEINKTLYKYDQEGPVFYNEMTYYGHVTNHNGTGYVHGELYFEKVSS